MKTVALVLTTVLCCIVATCRARCNILRSGVSENDSRIIVEQHNQFRKLISEGKVKNQPKGIGLQILIWDKTLAQKAQEVANTCIDEHVRIIDDRFPRLRPDSTKNVGQNIRHTNPVEPVKEADWRTTVQKWFNEHVNYHYPQDYDINTGHYLQIVWANTMYVGCGYTYYERFTNQVEELYVCNYGPQGNINGRAPYKTQ